MSYLSMIQKHNPNSIFLIEDGLTYTYGNLIAQVQALQKELSFPDLRTIYWIENTSIYQQLCYFFSCSNTPFVPVILAPDFVHKEMLATTPSIPPNSAMGVLTSGSTKEPTLWFRSFESWYDFFPTQNHVFKIDKTATVFIHGSLSFTGNLNMALGVLSTGGTLITNQNMNPHLWHETIKSLPISHIYLIPSKLRALMSAITLREKNTSMCDHVRMILSGSQSLGKHDITKFQSIYKNSRCILYYGSSELSYISYITDDEITEDSSLVGKAFHGITIQIIEHEIYVNTPFHVCGLTMPYSVGDLGEIDHLGYLHFYGRKNRVFNIHGRTIFAEKIERCLLNFSGILDAMVIVEEKQKLIAYIVIDPVTLPQSHKKISICLSKFLSNDLETYEIPRGFFFVPCLPKNENGKTDFKKKHHPHSSTSAKTVL